MHTKASILTHENDFTCGEPLITFKIFMCQFSDYHEAISPMFSDSLWQIKSSEQSKVCSDFEYGTLRLFGSCIFDCTTQTDTKYKNKLTLFLQKDKERICNVTHGMNTFFAFQNSNLWLIFAHINSLCRVADWLTTTQQKENMWISHKQSNVRQKGGKKNTRSSLSQMQCKQSWLPRVIAARTRSKPDDTMLVPDVHKCFYDDRSSNC